jgi:hypothetical protein
MGEMMADVDVVTQTADGDESEVVAIRRMY